MITATTTLAAGYVAVPPGHVATIVTSLEMVRPSQPRPERPLPPGIVLSPLADRDPDAYRRLFRAVGADWL